METGGPLKVELNLEVLVDKIELKDLVIGISLITKLVWKDKRITYLNIKDNFYQVTMNPITFTRVQHFFRSLYH